MNVKLLRKVKRHILAKPERLLMEEWLLHKEWCGDFITFGDFNARRFPRCRTVGCIAGWTCELSKLKNVRREDLCAQKLLGLTKKQANCLFLPNRWPDQFQDGLSGDGKKKTADACAARIEFFIKTKGTDKP